MMEAEDYTFAEMADIHFFYGHANGNAHEARRLYQGTLRIVDFHAAEHFRQMVSTLNILCNTQKDPST